MDLNVRISPGSARRIAVVTTTIAIVVAAVNGHAVPVPIAGSFASNNVLTAKTRNDNSETAHIHAITTAAQDAAQIVRRLREFHRPDDGALPA